MVKHFKRLWHIIRFSVVCIPQALVVQRVPDFLGRLSLPGIWYISYYERHCRDTRWYSDAHPLLLFPHSIIQIGFANMAWMKSFSSATFHLNKTNPPCNQVFLTHPKHSSSPVDLGHFCLFFIIACKSDSLRAWSLKVELEARRNQQILKVSKALARRNAPLRCSRKSPCHGLFRVLHNQAFSKTQTRQLVIFSCNTFASIMSSSLFFSYLRP